MEYAAFEFVPERTLVYLLTVAPDTLYKPS